MSTIKEIVKRVETRNKKTTDKNIRNANAIEGIFDLAVGIEGHVKPMGILECIKNIDGYRPNSEEMEDIVDAIWRIAEESTDTYEEAIGVITCAQFELQMGFTKASERVEMNGFIKNNMN